MFHNALVKILVCWCIEVCVVSCMYCSVFVLRQSHPELRFCPGPNCNVIVRAMVPAAKRVICNKCGTSFWFVLSCFWYCQSVNSELWAGCRLPMMQCDWCNSFMWLDVIFMPDVKSLSRCHYSFAQELIPWLHPSYRTFVVRLLPIEHRCIPIVM